MRKLDTFEKVKKAIEEMKADLKKEQVAEQKKKARTCSSSTTPCACFFGKARLLEFRGLVHIGVSEEEEAGNTGLATLAPSLESVQLPFFGGEDPGRADQDC